VVVRAPFFALFILATIGAVVGIILSFRRRQPLFIPGMWRILVLALPIFLIAGAMEPSQWDEFSHWLPAPKYLLAIDGFPNAAKPNIGPHMLSAYPYGWPILFYMSGRFTGGLLLNIGGTLNLLLLLTFTPFVLRTVMQIAGRPLAQSISWTTATVAALAATALNPTFVQKIVLTAYSGVSTSVITGLSVLVGYHFLESLARRNKVPPAAAAWHLSLVLMLLINLRQTNLAVFLILVLVLVVAAIRDQEVPIKKFTANLPLAVIPALVIYVAWRLYVGAELAGVPGGEAKFMPFDTWNINAIPQILSQMLVVVGKKIGFFGVMIIASVAAIIGLVRMRGGIDRLVLLCAAVFVGYNAVLLLTYVAYFSLHDALTVVSFWRYNIQIGALGVICILLGLVFLWKRYLGFDGEFIWARRASLVLVLALPVLFAPKLRFDLEPPKPHIIAVAKDLKKEGLVTGSLYVMDPGGSGESAVITRFHLDRYEAPWLSFLHRPTPASIREFINSVKVDEFLLVHSDSDGLGEALGQVIDPRRSYIFKRTVNGWKSLKSWPKPDNHPM